MKNEIVNSEKVKIEIGQKGKEKVLEKMVSESIDEEFQKSIGEIENFEERWRNMVEREIKKGIERSGLWRKLFQGKVEREVESGEKEEEKRDEEEMIGKGKED